MAPRRPGASPRFAWATINHVKEEASPKYFFALWLTQALCLRITQCLMLRTNDVDWKLKRIYIRRFKKHPPCWKPLVPSVFDCMKKAYAKGIKKRAGEMWSWPRNGYLFPSRRHATKPHINKDVISHIIVKVRKSFLKKNPHYKREKTIRSHSGRRHAISSYASGGLPPDVGMIWAQINSFRIQAIHRLRATTSGSADESPRQAPAHRMSPR